MTHQIRRSALSQRKIEFAFGACLPGIVKRSHVIVECCTASLEAFRDSLSPIVGAICLRPRYDSGGRDCLLLDDLPFELWTIPENQKWLNAIADGAVAYVDHYVIAAIGDCVAFSVSDDGGCRWAEQVRFAEDPKLLDHYRWAAVPIVDGLLLVVTFVDQLDAHGLCDRLGRARQWWAEVRYGEAGPEWWDRPGTVASKVNWWSL